MHHLITCVASMIILGIFFSQFVANENLFIESVSAERIIEEYLNEEYYEEEIPQKMMELKKEIDGIPNVEAEIRNGGLNIWINGIIGPEKAIGDRDNRILIEKDLKLRIKEAADEEYDDNSGSNDPDGTPQQIPDGSESDSAVTHIDRGGP